MSGDNLSLQAALDAIPHWYHRIELPGGVVTPGWAPLDVTHYRVPADLTGKRVLDVGAWDGFWTFEALKRGAREVVAIDDFSNAIYKGEQRGWKQFDFCRDALGYTSQQCSRQEMSVYDIKPAELGRFDVVLFFGVLYHLKHPMLGLERLADVTDDLLCVESAILDDYSPYKGTGYGDSMVMEFYPDDQYGQNATNWWVPTLRVMSTMIRSVGFPDVKSWKVENPSDLCDCRGHSHGKKATA
jgi:tRNA (mo5U34)-methyltransferase